MILTLWNDIADEEGQAIAHKIGSIPLIIAVGVKVSTFHGLSLTSLPYLCILIDPPVKEYEMLKNWYIENDEDIDALMNSESYRDLKLLLPPPQKVDVLTVGRAIMGLQRGKLLGWLAKQASPWEVEAALVHPLCQFSQELGL